MPIRSRLSLLFLLLPLVAASLGCLASLDQPPTPTSRPSSSPSQTSTVTVTFSPTPSSTATSTTTSTSTPSPSATASPTATPTATATPTPQPSATPPPTPTPLSLWLQLEIFTELWNIVDSEYLYPDFNGLDWDAIYDEYQLKIENGLSNADFYLALDEMIFRLGDDHSVYLSPEQVAQEEAGYAGNLDFVGIGVYLTVVPQRNLATILAVFPGSPAQAAGLQAHDSILAADGQSVVSEEGFLRDVIRGPEGTSVTLTVRTPGQAERQVTIERQRITGPMPVPYTVLTSPSGLRIGYILLLTFSDSTIDDQVGDALRAMSAEKPLDGIILDNRPNEGGASTVVSGVLSYFTSGTIGHFVNRHDESALDIRRMQDINGSQDLAMVILVGKDTVSFGEIFSGALQDLHRAYLIGETTDGNVETLWGYDFADGSRAWIAHETFRPVNNPQANWEENGIVPNLTVLADWDEYTLENDPVVLAALAYLDGGATP